LMPRAIFFDFIERILNLDPHSIDDQDRGGLGDWSQALLVKAGLHLQGDLIDRATRDDLVGEFHS
jgi:hypothetical protein